MSKLELAIIRAIQAADNVPEKPKDEFEKMSLIERMLQERK